MFMHLKDGGVPNIKRDVGAKHGTREIDLPSHQWQSDGEKKREPFFGSGAPEWFVYILALTVTLSVVYWLRQ